VISLDLLLVGDLVLELADLLERVRLRALGLARLGPGSLEAVGVRVRRVAGGLDRAAVRAHGGGVLGRDRGVADARAALPAVDGQRRLLERDLPAGERLVDARVALGGEAQGPGIALRDLDGRVRLVHVQSAWIARASVSV
jgi:hypothetical protein